MAAVLAFEPIENHGLMRSAAEGVADGEKKHGSEKQSQGRAHGKNGKRDDISAKGEYHGPSAAEHIGHGPARDFHDIDAYFAKSNQQTDHEEGKPFFQEYQYNERVVILLVF